jgi:hypothetical protein
LLHQSYHAVEMVTAHTPDSNVAEDQAFARAKRARRNESRKAEGGRAEGEAAGLEEVTPG